MSLNVALFNFHGSSVDTLYTIPKNVTLILYCDTDVCPIISSDLFLFKIATETTLETKIDYLSYIKNNQVYKNNYCVFPPGNEINDMILSSTKTRDMFVSGAYEMPIIYTSEIQNILKEEELYNLSKKIYTNIVTLNFQIEGNQIHLSYAIEDYMNRVGNNNDEYLFIVSACRGSTLLLDEKNNLKYSVDEYISKLKLEEEDYTVTINENNNQMTSFKIDKDLLLYYINPDYFSTKEKLSIDNDSDFIRNKHAIVIGDDVYSFVNIEQENKVLRYMFYLIETNDIVSITIDYVLIFNYYNSKIYKINPGTCTCEDVTDIIKQTWVNSGSVTDSTDNDEDLIYIRKNDKDEIIFSLNRERVSTSYLNGRLLHLIDNGSYNDDEIAKCIQRCVTNEITQGIL